MSECAAPEVIDLGRQPYEQVWQQMKDYTAIRDADTPDQLWLVEHDPVFTLGQAGDPSHLLRETGIPLVKTDRGGQITYHGPGQIVLYVLIDLKRRKMGIRALVTLLEETVVRLLAESGIEAAARSDAPGVYVDGAKIASLGLRVRRGCSYHGLALNIDLDLSPFSAINPCGYADLTVTSTRQLGLELPGQAFATRLCELFTESL